MRKEEDIIRGLKNLCKNNTIVVQPGIVKGFNQSDKSLSVLIDDLLYENVRLTAVNDETQKSYIVPKNESWVLVGFVENNETDAFVIVYSQVEEYYLNANKIVFNEGLNGGFVLIKELKEELSKINNILKPLLSIVTGTPIAEPGNGSPSALQIALGSALRGLTLPTYGNIENDKIIQ